MVVRQKIRGLDFKLARHAAFREPRIQALHQAIAIAAHVVRHFSAAQIGTLHTRVNQRRTQADQPLHVFLRAPIQHTCQRAIRAPLGDAIQFIDQHVGRGFRRRATQRAAREARVAAARGFRRLVDHRDRRAGLFRRQCRSHARKARAEDQHIVIFRGNGVGG